MEKTKKQQIIELSKEITRLNEVLKYTKDERANECEFKVGEQVKVFKIIKNYRTDPPQIQHEYLGEGTILSFGVDNDGEFYFKRIQKIKKDGTPSKTNYNDWDNYHVEKLQNNG